MKLLPEALRRLKAQAEKKQNEWKAGVHVIQMDS
jgi:hypothetical protein